MKNVIITLLLKHADMSKFPFLATGSFQFGGIAAQVNVMQCCRLFPEYYPENVNKKMYAPPLQFWGLNPSFFMIWESLAHPSPCVEPPLGQLKLLSRHTEALVRNISTGNLCTILSFKA